MEIPKPIANTQGYPVYFSENNGSLAKKEFHCHSWSSLGCSLGISGSVDSYCARKSAEAYNKVIGMNSGSDFENLTIEDLLYIEKCVSFPCTLLDDTVQKTDSIGKSTLLTALTQEKSPTNPSDPPKTTIKTADDVETTATPKTLKTLTHEKLVGLVCVLYIRKPERRVSALVLP